MEKEDDMMRYTRSFLALLMFLAISTEGLAGIWTNNDFLYKPGPGARGEREKSTYDSGLDRVDARLAKEVWVGDPKFGATLQDALTTLGAATAVLRVPKGTTNVAANLTIPANITLKPERGASFAVATGKTLTINGGLEAGLYQIFSCTGTGKVVFTAGSNTTIYPQWWGAVPTASQPDAAVMTANTAAIQASFDAISNYTSWTLPPGQYYCNASFVYGSPTVGAYNYGITMDFKGKFWFSGCGGIDFNNLNFSNVRGITVYRTTQAWDIGTAPDATDFGVRLSQTRRCNISIDDVQDFTYGVYLNGNDGMTNAMITLNLGNFIENRYGIYVYSTRSGWNTEMQFFGGHFWSNRNSITDHANIDTENDTFTHATALEIYLCNRVCSLLYGS